MVSAAALPMIRVLRENKQTPRWVEELVTRAGGRNRYGEPNFRVVWGWSRLSLIGGKWSDYDENGNLVREVMELRKEPKYFPHDRWHIERWIPPEAYGTPDQWYSQTSESGSGQSVPALGPYPRQGEWEHCFTIQTPDGKFLGLTPAICDGVVRAIEWSRAQPAATRRAALDGAKRKREREYENFVDDVLWNEPRFHGQPYVVTP